MVHAFRSSFATALALLVSVLMLAQVSELDLANYVRWTQAPVAGLTNFHSVPLVAFRWDDTPCAGERPQTEGAFDAAVDFSPPLKTKATAHFKGFDEGCIRASAAIFADGLEMGDSRDLQRIKDCRTASWAELQETFLDDLSKVSVDDWSPQQSIERLVARRIAFVKSTEDSPPGKYELNQCHVKMLDLLILRIGSYQSSLEKDPEEYGPRRARFLQYMKDWKAALSSRIYSYPPTDWRK